MIPNFLDAESETDFDNKSEVFSVPIDMKEIARVHEEEDSDDGADAFDSDAEEAESEEYDSDDFTDESTDDEAD